MSQPQDSMTLQQFATLHSLTKNQAVYLVTNGRVMGAHKTHGGKWLVFPPAKISEPLRKRTTWRDRVPDAAASAVGTSPHGLSVNGHQSQPESSQNSGAESLADGFEVLLGQDEVRPASNTMPEVFGSAKLKAAARTIALSGSTLHYPLVLTGSQILAIERAIEHELLGLAQQAEWNEFEPEKAGLHEAERVTLQQTQRLIRNATTETNQANGRKSNNTGMGSI